MYTMHEEVARQRARDAQHAAAVHRMVRRAQSAQSAQRWQRVAAWAEHRSVQAREQDAEAADQ